MTIAQLRNEYSRASLDEKHVDRDPLSQFEAWFQQALSAQVAEPNAMVLATATPEGRPSARVVLLKGADSRGFTFFTDYSSRKGRELETNPQAALVFFWPELERQVRITGRISKITRKESEAYFRSRPRGSRLAASASLQSAPLKDRAQLEQAYAELDARHPGEEVPLPRRWGGYRVRPDSLEFWQGRPNRLHDRILFTRKRQGWRISRLSP